MLTGRLRTAGTDGRHHLAVGGTTVQHLLTGMHAERNRLRQVKAVVDDGNGDPPRALGDSPCPEGRAACSLDRPGGPASSRPSQACVRDRPTSPTTAPFQTCRKYLSSPSGEAAKPGGGTAATRPAAGAQPASVPHIVREPHAYMSRRRFGSGTGSPNSLAVSTQSCMASLAFASAASWVSPWTIQPGSSGTSATNTPSLLS